MMCAQGAEIFYRRDHKDHGVQIGKLFGRDAVATSLCDVLGIRTLCEANDSQLLVRRSPAAAWRRRKHWLRLWRSGRLFVCRYIARMERMG